jgi:Zn-dependent protease with chaperone function
LSPAELEEVRAHEAAHRQRRTILHRVEQLLAGGHGVQP